MLFTPRAQATPRAIPTPTSRPAFCERPGRQRSVDEARTTMQCHGEEHESYSLTSASALGLKTAGVSACASIVRQQSPQRPFPERSGLMDTYARNLFVATRHVAPERTICMARSRLECGTVHHSCWGLIPRHQEVSCWSLSKIALSMQRHAKVSSLGTPTPNFTEGTCG